MLTLSGVRSHLAAPSFISCRWPLSLKAASLLRLPNTSKWSQNSLKRVLRSVWIWDDSYKDPLASRGDGVSTPLTGSQTVHNLLLSLRVTLAAAECPHLTPPQDYSSTTAFKCLSICSLIGMRNPWTCPSTRTLRVSLWFTENLRNAV